MKHARSRAFTNLGRPLKSKRSLRVITFFVCFVLLLSSVGPLWNPTAIANDYVPITNTRAQQGDSSNKSARRVDPLPPRLGPPAANLPNLDQLRSGNNPSRIEAPGPIPSTLRSRRKSNELPPGLRVGHARVVTDGLAMRSHHATARNSKAPRVAAEPLPVVPQSGRTNFALAANASVATASSTYTQCCGFTPAAAIDGEHKGLNWSNGGGWHGATSTFPQWLQIDFNATRTIDEIDVFNIQDNFANPIEPSETTTFSLYGLTGFDVQYWTGTAWLTVPGGNVSGNNKVWKKVTFSAVSTTKIRLVTNASVDGWTRLIEVEAWGPATAMSTNVALAANGSVATASSNYAPNGDFSPSPAGAIDGEHRGSNYLTTGAWHSSTPTVPQWLQIDFNGSKTIDQISVFSLHDNYSNPPEPNEATTFCLHGLTAFEVQYWNGASWVTVPGGNVTGYNNVWKKITFAPITTSKIRVVISANADGWSRVVEVEAWSALSGNGGSPSDFAIARLNPLNRTGTGGEDLLSNNFNWNLPLVGLKGRGLDLGLTLSYNSLVWIKAGNSINFDLDKGSIAPGFRLGFPTVEGPHFNSQANANFYLLITPSGGRIELRQIGTSIVYESKDSTYLQLIDNLNGTLTLRPTDGSQMKFIGVDGAWRCNQIKDRNGNVIDATYKSWGELETVTDTMNRVLTFKYDSNSNLQSIEQTWAGETHEWATFGWGTASIGNNFPGLNNLGPNSTSIPVLTQVGLGDGSRYNFEYNNTYGMVSKVRHHASDNRLRRQTTYVAPGSASDCPRLSERRDWAAHWNGDSDENPTTSEEAITYFAHDADNGRRMTLPDGTVHKEYYGSSWQSGLTTETRSYATVANANSTLWQKKTTTAWTQDNTSVGYLTNPRVTETNVYDASNNRRRTTIDYGPSNLGYVQWGLPHIVKEYADDGTTELRRSQTDYNLSQLYLDLDRRIIGLVSSSQLYDSLAGQWLSKTTYEYDTTAIDAQATAATQHDTAYSQSLNVRGNVTRVSRWDVTDIDNDEKQLSSTLTYNAAGSVLSATDPDTHTTTIHYSDSFVDGINRNTFAYPTTVTDADGFSSFVKYNFDFGAKTRIEGPPPQNQSQGITQTFSYDEAMRLKRVTTVNTGAYVHYDYGPNYTSSFASVNTVAANYWESDSYTNRFFDGLERVFAVASNHPSSTGGNKGQYTRYDQMGRPVQQTNPFEMDSGWNPTGDDAMGYQFNVANTFDWQGRPVKTYNMDGTFKEASYSGCGCAGGEVVTLTDEVG